MEKQWFVRKIEGGNIYRILVENGVIVDETFENEKGRHYVGGEKHLGEHLSAEQLKRLGFKSE